MSGDGASARSMLHVRRGGAGWDAMVVKDSFRSRVEP